MSDDMKMDKENDELKPIIKPERTVERAKPMLVEMRILHPTPYSGRTLCVSVDEKNAYLVPTNKVPNDMKKTFSINPDDKDVEILYDWDSELEAMLPTREMMKRHARISLWLSGNHHKDQPLSRDALKRAFPYRIE